MTRHDTLDWTKPTHPIRWLSPRPGLSEPQHVQGGVQLAQGMPENAGAGGQPLARGLALEHNLFQARQTR